MRILLYSLLFLCLGAGRLAAQQQYLFTRLGIRDGLASNSVMALQQDAKGYIWIGTSNGLQRYDGYKMLLFQHRLNDPRSLPNNIVQQLLLDRSNRLWILSAFNRVGYMDLSDLQYHEVPTIIAEDDRNKGKGRLYMDQAGHIMLFLIRRAILTYDEKISAFHPGNRPFPVPPGWKPISFFQDSASNYWLGSDSGLVKYDPARRTLSYRGHNADSDVVIAGYGRYTNIGFPYIDHSGRFWVLYWPLTGVGPSYLSLDIRTGREHNWSLSIARCLQGRYNELNYISEASDGTVALAGVNMLVILRPGSEGFELVRPNAGGEFSLYYDVVQQWIEDKEHNIWLATDRGLYWFNPGAQLCHSVALRMPGRDSVFTPEVTGVRQLQNGDIVVTTWGNGLFAYDSLFRPVSRWYIQGLRPFRARVNQAWCIVQRPNGDIWSGHQQGWIHISHWASRRTEQLHLPIVKNSTIRQMLVDKDGNVWIGTQHGELIRWEARTGAYTVMSTLGSPVQRLYLDNRGDVWACTEMEGVYRVRPGDGAILNHYTTTEREGWRLSGVGAADIVQYSDSLYIIATHNLDILNVYTGRIRSDTSVTGALFSGATNVIPDRKGYIWITNAEGLHKLSFTKQLASTFYEMDGVGSNAFNLGSGYQLKDGRVAIGTTHDVLVFQPALIRNSELAPNDVEITGIWANNKPLSVDSVEKLEELELPYGENSLRISLSTLAYQDVSGIMYRLEGIDKDWIDAKSNDAVYNYLPPGRYTFGAEGVNAENMVSRNMRRLAIHVHGPFWRSWWFLCLVLLAGAALLYVLDRQRMQRKAALENMRSDISGNLHEEVNQALQNINVLSEIARIKAEKDPEQAINYINEIHHKSHNMIIAMDDMLWAIDPVNDNMTKAIARMREFAEALNHRHGVRIRLHADNGVERLHPDMNIRHELLLIYKLVLRVLVEEANAQDTLVQLEQDHGMLNLSVYSKGIRIDHRSGRAIRLVEEARSRASAIRGALDLHSDEKGTAVLFTCPSTF
ncbi:MAG: hypothetical protein JST42_12705 [Bacteroidetes bacterium]|nr:hypothetical protein [Bacteroidota bacterium]